MACLKGLWCMILKKLNKTIDNKGFQANLTKKTFLNSAKLKSYNFAFSAWF